MYNRKKIKEEAKNLLRAKNNNILSSGVFWNVFSAILIQFIFMGVFARASFKSNNTALEIISSYIVQPVLLVGVAYVLWNLYKDKVADMSNIFVPMVSFRLLWKTIVINVIYSLLILLGLVFLIVPGIYFLFKYSQIYNILAVHPELSIKEIFKKSGRIMNGYNLQFFLLELSFIPWILLTAITSGIVGIYVLPYMATASFVFYTKVCKLAKEEV